MRICFGRPAVKEAHDWYPGLLRARCERPRSRRAADERDELAPFHSITSSARSRIDVGNSMPIALAVLRFTTRLSGKLPSLYDPPLAPSKHLLRVSEYAGRRALEAF